MAERTLIDYARSIKLVEAKEILSEIEKAPMAKPLVMLFERETDPGTYRALNSNFPNLYGNLKEKDIDSSMVIRKESNFASLDILSSQLERLPHPDDASVFCYKLAEIYARKKQTGVWCYSKGNETFYAIMVELKREIVLPDNRNKWLFDLMGWFALISREHCLDMSEQRKFWEGNKLSLD